MTTNITADLADPLESAPFELARSRLRFVRAEVEREYQTWRAQAALSFQRASFAAVAGLWTACIVAQRWANQPRFDVVGACAAASISVALARMFVYRRPAFLSWVLPLTSLSLVVAGSLGVGVVCWWLAHLPDVALAGAIILTFFAFTIVQLSPRLALSTVLPVWMIHFYFVIGDARAGAIGAFSVASHVLTALSVLGSALVVGLVLERTSRERFRQERIIEAQQAIIGLERDRANRLLHTILPAAIAERLKRAPGVIADRFEEATVLFADIVGFTPLAARLRPEELVAILNDIFTRFDALAGQFGVEKIKTIGDAYMVVAGVPEPRDDHASAAADFALAMRAAVADYGAENGRSIEVRIGMCSGPVVAGVIGTRKLAYDLWGDTVNTAARMESHGAPGRIQLAESTYRRLAGRYRVEERGSLDIKGKGQMQAWFLHGPDSPTGRGEGNDSGD